MHAVAEGGAHMHGAMLRGGHGLKRAWAPACQLAALRGLVPQLRILLDGLQGSGHQHSSWGSKARPWTLLSNRCFCTWSLTPTCNVSLLTGYTMRPSVVLCYDATCPGGRLSLPACAAGGLATEGCCARGGHLSHLHTMLTSQTNTAWATQPQLLPYHTASHQANFLEEKLRKFASARFRAGVAMQWCTAGSIYSQSTGLLKDLNSAAPMKPFVARVLPLGKL